MDGNGYVYLVQTYLLDVNYRGVTIPPSHDPIHIRILKKLIKVHFILMKKCTVIH